MRDHEWSVFDSLAYEISPNDTLVRQQDLLIRLQNSEAKLVPIFEHIQVLANIFFALAGMAFLLSIVAAFWNHAEAKVILSNVLWPLFVGSLLHLASHLWRHPGFELLLPPMLKHPDLQIFHDHLKRTACGEIEVGGKHNQMIAPEFLRSTCAIVGSGFIDWFRR